MNQSVLIVDDEPDIRELLDITLSRMGLVTHSAATLKEAREMVELTCACRMAMASAW